MLKKGYFIILLSLFIRPMFAEDATVAKKENLARITILPFYDNTGTKDFGYLPGSLRDAIVKSMHKKFEFVETPEEEILFYYPEEKLDYRNDESYIKNSAQKLNSDVIIYGEYEFDKHTEKVTIKPKIYFVPIKENASLPSVTNPVDSTIFQVTEKVAENINSEINRMLDIYAKKSESKVETVENKKVINKESLATRGMVWAIGPTVQILYNPNTQGSVFFAGFFGEQYFNPSFSGYGTLAYGRSSTGMNYVKVPAVGILAGIGSLLTGVNFFVNVPGLIAMDGIAYNLKIGDDFQIAPFAGLILALPVGKPIATDSLFGVEAGLRLNYYIGEKLRAGLSGGSYYSFGDKSFSINAGLAFTYLTGK